MEGKKMKKKGFTLVELLVVIAIIAMLLAILMPALAKVRTLAQRLMCGTNIGGIGKAMLTYASDDKYESYPIAGFGTTIWDFGTSGGSNGKCSWNWNCKDNPGTGRNAITDNPCKATIGACLYLLVKYADVPPEQFVCPGAPEKKFELSNYKTGSYTDTQNVTDVWDFGTYADRGTNYARGWGHNSYSYQLPLPLDVTDQKLNKPHPISASSSPALVILADRNPWWMEDNPEGKEMTDKWLANMAALWNTDTCTINNDYLYMSNSYNHQRDGQNVLYADQHVRFEKSSLVGVEKDNIYTTWNFDKNGLPTDACLKAKQKQVSAGSFPSQSDGKNVSNFSQDDTDTYLVQDFYTE
jgi:prepilin-type N-terminal cleavage/methylation domain-containing protein